MRVAIHTLGTRGDVQPYVALALGLIAGGHQVQIAGPMQFQGFAEAHGVAFAPLPGEFLDLLGSPEGKDAIAGGKGFSAGFKLLKHVRPLMRGLMDAEWSALGRFDPQIIVYHPKSLAAPHMAERLGRPSLLASPLPGFTPTSAFPSPMLPFRDLGPLNRASHALATHGGGLLFGKLIREWRQSALGLAARAPRGHRPTGTLYAYSPHVLPAPPDWGRDVLVSGYWFLGQHAWEPPRELLAFLEAGEPPVYVGFGSMPGLQAQDLTSRVVAGLALAGKRGILDLGGGALATASAPPSVHFITGAPHEWLFPRVSATVHHGGAGTTAASLRAGGPTATCPFFGDQPFWARRVADIGVGPGPLDRKTLSPQTLAAALATMAEPGMLKRAADLGTRIRAEDGVATAITFIEKAGAERGA